MPPFPPSPPPPTHIQTHLFSMATKTGTINVLLSEPKVNTHKEQHRCLQASAYQGNGQIAS